MCNDKKCYLIRTVINQWNCAMYKLYDQAFIHKYCIFACITILIKISFFLHNSYFMCRGQLFHIIKRMYTVSFWTTTKNGCDFAPSNFEVKHSLNHSLFGLSFSLKPKLFVCKLELTPKQTKCVPSVSSYRLHMSLQIGGYSEKKIAERGREREKTF